MVPGGRSIYVGLLLTGLQSHWVSTLLHRVETLVVHSTPELSHRWRRTDIFIESSSTSWWGALGGRSHREGYWVTKDHHQEVRWARTLAETISFRWRATIGPASVTCRRGVQEERSSPCDGRRGAGWWGKGDEIGFIEFIHWKARGMTTLNKGSNAPREGATCVIK